MAKRNRKNGAGRTGQPRGVALLLVDVINDLDFDGGERLLEHALAAADALEPLLARARRAGIPVIYANDNFGHWRDDFREVLRHCLEDGVPGEPVARRLAPREDDYFILKPRHSAFFGTPLDHLLADLEVEELTIAGFATDQCVLLTAADAHIRGLRVRVPRDASAAETAERHEQAMAWIERVAKADVRPAGKVRFPAGGAAEPGRRRGERGGPRRTAPKRGSGSQAPA